MALGLPRLRARAQNFAPKNVRVLLAAQAASTSALRSAELPLRVAELFYRRFRYCLD